MDSSLPQSSTFDAERKAENSLVFPTKTQFLKSYRRQLFSLPDSIMHYMALNPPSAEVYEKLVKSCKYFFIKNPILLLSWAVYYENKWEINNIHGERKNIIELCNISSKLWITTGSFNVHGTNVNNIASSFISKIYKCDVRQIILAFQIFSYHEFMVLASSNVTYLFFSCVSVKYGDRTDVSLERIVEQLPNVKSMFIYCPPATSMITSETMKELCEISHFATLDDFTLLNIPEEFNIVSFYTYMKKNKVTSIELDFCDTISEGYKGRLEAIVDEVIEAETREYKTPLIRFPGLDDEKRQKLCDLHYRRN